MTTDLLDLAREIGLTPKRTSSTKGGEYHSSCPNCEGKDRFIIWPGSNAYWCRQCTKSGDAIQFCRDFLGMSFTDACRRLGENRILKSSYRIETSTYEPLQSNPPTSTWQERAQKFAKQCHDYLLSDHAALVLLKTRQITLATASRFNIGYNPQDTWEERGLWGMPAEKKEDGRLKQQWMPTGLVIPTISKETGLPIKLKVRRSKWKEVDMLPKYVEVSGSQKQFSIYGDISLPVILVEAELDAIILQQEASDLCCSIALGGAGKRPDREIHNLLQKNPSCLFSLDFDEAGKKAYLFWKETYPRIKAWPAPKGKSPSESYQQGVNLHKWVKAGIFKLSEN